MPKYPGIKGRNGKFQVRKMIAGERRCRTFSTLDAALRELQKRDINRDNPPVPHCDDNGQRLRANSELCVGRTNAN